MKKNKLMRLISVLFLFVLNCSCQHETNFHYVDTADSQHKDSINERFFRKWELVQINYRAYIPEDVQTDRSMRQLEQKLDSSEWLVFDFRKNGDLFIEDSLAGKFQTIADQQIRIAGDWLDTRVPFFFNSNYSLLLYPTYMNMTTNFFQGDKIHHSIIFVFRKYYRNQ